jgi:transposase
VFLDGLYGPRPEDGPVKKNTLQVPRWTVGLDVGDKWCHIAVVDRGGKLVEKSRVPTESDALRERFRRSLTRKDRLRVILEAGPHSHWISRLLEEEGNEVIVANPRRLKMIYDSDSKSDDADAEALARLGRLDPSLLRPIKHRSLKSQSDLTVIRSRDALVKARTQLVNHVRGVAKSFGVPLKKCSTKSFHHQVPELLPEILTPSLMPILDAIEGLSRKIAEFDRVIEAKAVREYPATERLRQVRGVGPITSLSYVLILDDASRFRNSRDAGSYIGLRPRRDQSGERDPELRITKAGDQMLRCLLVGSAQYILGPFGEDCDLRRWGLKLAARGGKNAKKKAIVATARKLAVLLHHLWKTGEDYEPLRNQRFIDQQQQQLAS